MPTEGSYDLDLYVAPETHTRWEMWNHDATFGGEEGIERDGVVMRLELIKRFPAWKKISYSVVGDEQIIMTDVFSFEQTINALVFRQTRSLLNFKRGEVGKKPSSKVKNSEYIYTLKKL